MKKPAGCTWDVNSAWILPMPKLSQKQELRQQLTPRQILQASLLQLNLPLLEQRILHELEINPALEMIELTDDVNGDELQDIEKSCKICIQIVIRIVDTIANPCLSR